MMTFLRSQVGLDQQQIINCDIKEKLRGFGFRLESREIMY